MARPFRRSSCPAPAADKQSRLKKNAPSGAFFVSDSSLWLRGIMFQRGFNMKKTIGLLTLAFCAVFVPQALAQQARQKWTTATEYTVAKGDSVPSIVNKVKYPAVTESQMY